jgi:hypothetical protein
MLPVSDFLLFVVPTFGLVMTFYFLFFSSLLGGNDAEGRVRVGRSRGIRSGFFLTAEIAPARRIPPGSTEAFT